MLDKPLEISRVWRKRNKDLGICDSSNLFLQQISRVCTNLFNKTKTIQYLNEFTCDAYLEGLNLDDPSQSVAATARGDNQTFSFLF